MAKKAVMYRRRTSLPTPPGGGGGETLWGRFSPVGAFRLDHTGSTHSSRFAFSRHGLAYDGGSDTLIASGHETIGTVRQARVEIPTPVLIGSDTDAGNLPIAAIVSSDFQDLGGGLVSDIPSGMRISGYVLEGTDWWATQEPHYNFDLHPWLIRSDNTTHLTSLNSDGPWGADVHHKRLCRYVTMIPQAWATAHVGGKRLLAGCPPIAGHTPCSFGPAATAVALPTQPYNPQEVLPTQAMLFYPLANPAVLLSGQPWNSNAVGNVFGVAWIEDGADNWLVYLCQVGTGTNWYGPGASYPFYDDPRVTGNFRGAWNIGTAYVIDDRVTHVDPSGHTISYLALTNHQGSEPPSADWSRITSDPFSAPKGYHAPPYETQLWIYHADDLLGVIAGTDDSWEPIPREIVPISSLLFHGKEFRRDSTPQTPILSRGRFACSLAWDQSGGRLFLAENFGDWVQTGEQTVVVHVFQMDGGA